ncbi:MAG TPA: glucose 1-dehydrogenase [Terriglobales bacterium]|nr:glucose 1-dehydrogenase [Terriglobales bacterium]
MSRLTDQVALVTGAGSGMGRAIALRLAQAGAAVAVADLNPGTAGETVSAITTAGGRAIAVTMDVTQLESVQAGAAAIERDLGAITILVNNAGWDRLEPFAQNDPALWDTLIGINLKGPIYCCRAVLDQMIAAGGGKIVSISSDAARVGSTGEAVYSACKGGIISFSKTLARELARHKINVNVLCPGPTETPLLESIAGGREGAKVIEAIKRSIPLRRLGKPEDIAGAVLFFVSADADFITGQVLSVSGGLTMC